MCSILEFLRFYNPDPSAPLGVVPDVMSTFVKSCAGYCVITYILGTLPHIVSFRTRTSIPTVDSRTFR